ncbi:hypothetical protein Pcinc_015068 [Petrolisthes cinctipes]|uniref:RAB6-interacting golgin n=1 Tax=Petrolisthes cinctipes TaxID=88211 RepID=A0AAE1FVC6_PETCI|nr:hypothetical protein Pcinc_015068 [Petrolisthes cinctipes]
MISKGWAGFTDDDINNVKKQNAVQNATSNEKTVSKPEIHTARFQSGKAGVKGKTGLNQTTKMPVAYTPIPVQARLSHTKETNISGQSQTQSSSQVSSESSESSSTESQSPVPPSPCKSPTGSHAMNVKIRLGDNNSYEVIPTNGKGATDPSGREDMKKEGEAIQKKEGVQETVEKELTLERLQQQQKLIEEQNKRRRELLVQAIADRSRQTQFEAQKLKQIQTELGKLDSLLSTDVGILRDQIEMASLEFNEAQKRYDRAEREYIEAKLQLFSRLEKKELLTEHLCRIIEANERRKASKLSQLMAELELADVAMGGGEANHTPSDQVLPQLASLDEVTYAACNTIKDPRKTSLALQKGLSKINGDIPLEDIQKLINAEKPDEGTKSESGVSDIKADSSETESGRDVLVADGGAEGGAGDADREEEQCGDKEQR